MIQNKMRLLVTLCLGLQLSVTAQTDIYKPILSSGKIPSEFTLHLPTMYQRTKATLDFSKTNFDRKQQDLLITALVKEEYEYILDGKMVFGDPISARVLPIFEKLKSTDKDFANMRCVVVREGTKIFAIGGDIVAVPIEFISQISSESQLAMLMADVMIKFRNHQLEKQMKATNYNPNLASYNHDKLVSSVVSNLGRFQMNTVGLYKDNISDALTVLIDAGYKLDDLDFVYSTIKYAYLPYSQGNLTFSEFVGSPFSFSTKDLIESATYKDTFSYDRSGFTDEEEEEKITDFSPSKYDDMEAELTSLLSKKQSSGTFLSMTEKEFQQFLELAQLETIAMDLKQGAYQKVIYNASLMLKKNPSSKALRVFKAQALLSIAQIRLSRMYDEFDLNANFTELSNAYLRLTVEQKGAIAMRYIHENSQLFPDDQQTQKHVNYIQRFMKNEVKINLAGDYRAEEYVYVAQANTNEGNEGKELSKLDKIKQKKTEELTGGDSLQTITAVFHKYGLKSLLGDTKFMKEYADIKPKKTDEEIEEEKRNKKKKETLLPKILTDDDKVFVTVHDGFYYSKKVGSGHKKTKLNSNEVVFEKVKGLYDKMNTSNGNQNISYSIPDVTQNGEITADFLNGRFLEYMMMNDNIHLKNSFFYGPNFSYRTLKYMHYDFIYAPNTYYNYTSDYFGENRYLIAQEFFTQVYPGKRVFTLPMIVILPLAPFSPLVWRVEEMGAHGLYDLENDYFVYVSNSVDYNAFGKLKIYKKSFKTLVSYK